MATVKCSGWLACFASYGLISGIMGLELQEVSFKYRQYCAGVRDVKNSRSGMQTKKDGSLLIISRPTALSGALPKGNIVNRN